MVGRVEGVEGPHRERLAAVSPAEQLEQRYNHNGEKGGAREQTNVASLGWGSGEGGGVRGVHAPHAPRFQTKGKKENSTWTHC